MSRYRTIEDMVDAYGSEAQSLHHRIAAGGSTRPGPFQPPVLYQADVDQVAYRGGRGQETAQAGGYDPIGHMVQYEGQGADELQTRVNASQALRLGRASGSLLRVMRIR